MVGGVGLVDNKASTRLQRMAPFHDKQIFDGRTYGFFGQTDIWTDSLKKSCSQIVKEKVLTDYFGQFFGQFLGKF